MKFKTTKIIDFFLLQKDFYSKLTDKSMWLYIGIALVGIRDVVLSVLGKNIDTSDNVYIQLDLRTAAILFAVAMIIGLVDTMCFSYPIFDIIKYFKKKNDSNSMAMGVSFSSLLTKVIKVYIIVNIILTPLDLLSYFTTHMALVRESATLGSLSLVFGVLGYFWFNGAITRGLCVLFKLPNSVRGLIFVLVFLWNALLNSALNLVFDQVILRLLH